MNKYRKFKALAGIGGGLLLLTAALTAWGINITLSDGDNSVTCVIIGTTTIDANGDINTTVNPGSTCDLSGGGSPPPPPPPGSFTLSVGKTGTGGGTVTSSPAGINCGADCSQAYTDGTSVSLSAVPATGSTFGGWSGACTGTGPCTLIMTANRSVTATFTAEPPPPGSCGPTPPDVTIVDTGNLNADSPTVEFSPAPDSVIAFKVHVPSGFSGRDDFRATRLPPATKAKAIVVSSCPGAQQPVAASGCTKENVTDTALIRLSANPSDNQFVYCKLTPGETYYINAFSKNVLDAQGANCSSTSTCRFQAFRGQPY